jgi:Zn-dependent metalloprotease
LKTLKIKKMKKLITLLFTSAFMLFSLFVKAQQIQKGNPGMWPAFIKYNTSAPAFNKSSVAIVDEAGKPASVSNGIIKNVETDAKGMVHYRYQQSVNGIAIENADMIVHVANGKIKSQNGKWIKDFPADMQLTASLSAATALNKAQQNIGASKYKWELPAEEAFLKREQNDPNATFYPKATLVYYSGERDVIPSAIRLAYKFDVYAQDPISRQLIFVDAVNGKILGKRELLHETNTTGTAQTAYSGTQTITSDFTGANYRLREAGRGAGTSINTYNMLTGTNYASAVDFTDADNNWNNVNAAKDEYATDAHWATEKTYDYFYQKYNRNSIDNAGMTLNSYVHFSVGYFNAFWDGSRMTYGDGDATNGNKPLTSLDVCGHEITHGITERTSNLVYSYESGAMNEGFSDIFGTAIEAFARPGNTDWLIGGDFFTIRNMSNPNAFNDPDTYGGTFWYNSSGDNGGVHTNSGVLNYWFYLLTVGGSGINDHNVSFNVTGIGMDKAAAIAYRLNTVYLVSTSQYYDARILGIQAAEDLYGVGSPEAIQTANAWTAVGLYAATCASTSGLHAVHVLDRSATLKWTPESGANYYNIQFKENAYTEWSSVITTTADSINLGGLTASTLYDYRVRTSCNGSYTAAQFTTAAPICDAPAGISFVTGTSTAVLSWYPQWYAVSYDIEYKLPADNVWISAGNTTASTFTITGLTAPTTYDCRIRNNCSFGSSPFSQFQFTTTLTPCDAPTGLAFTYNSTNNTSTFTWNAVPGAVDYTFQLAWAGGSWGALDDITTTNSYDVTNLMQGGNFQFRVTTNCGGSYSLPSSTFLFTTPCSAPGGLTTTNITNSGATLNWVPAAVNNNGTTFSVAYRLGNTNNAWTSIGNTNASTINVSGLMPGTLYEWRVRKLCSALNSADVIAQFTTTGSSCNTPTGLKTAQVSPSGAKLSWTAVSGALSYNVQYKTAAATTWTTVSGITGNTHTINNLVSNTVYNCKVQTVCASGSSAYSSVVSFTTYCASSGTNTQDWIDYFKLGTMIRSSGAEAGGYYNAGTTITPLNIVVGTTGIAGTISAGYTGGTKKQNYAIYIDFNRNGSFADAGERVVGQSSTTNGGNFNFTVNIPATATPGITPVRVVMRRQPTAISPCLVGNSGETEDYYINLTAASFQGFGENTITAGEAQTKTATTDIAIGPNPSTGRYNVTFNGDFSPVQYDIINTNGQAVKSAKVVSAKVLQLDITSMPAGLYLLRLTDRSGKRETLRLVKE